MLLCLDDFYTKKNEFMADLIHLLPDSVANQIAAGEVIQRPASVVKELVENAIDAKAKMIQVKVVDAGKTLIQVIDDGTGMSETDARMAFERHATSKIKAASDLFSLQTMGFRGEALPSIAAVAQVELRTRVEGAECGVCVRIEGGGLVGSEIVSATQGSNFIVKNLFYNIPARRKFLKSNQTEFNNVVQEFERIALAHPDIAFTLYHGDTMVYNLGVQNFHKRINDLFGKRFEKVLIPISVDTTIVQAEGFVGLPNSAKRKVSQQFFLTNGRYMRHPMFAKAIVLAYDRLIPDGDQVPFFINLKVDPAKLDVNIHPQKTEIKFEDENAIFQILQAAVREALGRYNAVPSIDFDVENKPEIPIYGSDLGLESGGAIAFPEVEVDHTFNPFNAKQNSKARPTHVAKRKDWGEIYDGILVSEIEKPVDEQITLLDNLKIDEARLWTRESGDAVQISGRYIVTQVEGGMLLVDQHRAHERVLYEEYIKNISLQKVVSQQLLFPTIVHLTKKEAQRLNALLEEFANLGFEIIHMGGDDFSVHALPLGSEGVNPTQILQDVLSSDEMNTSVRSQVYTRIAEVLAMRSAIPYGQYLSQKECMDLLDSLFALPTSTFTPRGKKIYVILKSSDISAYFEK